MFRQGNVTVGNDESEEKFADDLRFLRDGRVTSKERKAAREKNRSQLMFSILVFVLGTASGIIIFLLERKFWP